MAIIGIDLGTTNSLVAVCIDNKCEVIPNSFGEELTPSVVSIDDDGSILVGKIAKERLISHPELTASSFKRYMGTDKKIKLGDRFFRAEELSSFVLKKLKEDAEKYLNEEVTEAVISVPAYFNDYQRSATKAAGELAGLKVERLINEPSAAALAYKIDKNKNECNFLVFDIGGGTLDISVIEIFENVIEVTSVAGDNHLGGDDFNNAIVEDFLRCNNLNKNNIDQKKLAVLKKSAESCKFELTKDENAVVNLSMTIDDKEYSSYVSNKKIIDISCELFARIEEPFTKALRDSNKTIDDIDDVILVGGSSKMPVIRAYVKHLFKREPLIDIDPDQIVGYGAGIQAGIKERNINVKDILLTDVCPFSLGIATVGDEILENKFSAIIDRNSILPTSIAQIYTTTYDFQEIIKIEVYQGESLDITNNIKLGEFDVKVPKNIKGKELVEVRFTYDINGILEVQTTVLSNNDIKKQVIVSKGSRLTKEEINKKLKELSKYKLNNKDTDESKMLIAVGERLFEEASGEIRNRISYLLSYYSEMLKTHDFIKIKKAYNDIMMEFKQIDEYYN